MYQETTNSIDILFIVVNTDKGTPYELQAHEVEPRWVTGSVHLSCLNK